MRRHLITIVRVLGWQVALLPFIEQNALWGYAREVADNSYGVSGARTWNCTAVSDSNPFTTVLPAFLCPSDGRVGRGSGTTIIGGTNYRGCIGDNPITSTNSGTMHRGMIGGALNPVGRRYVRTMSSVADGTSNTLLFSEGLIATYDTRHTTIERGIFAVAASPETTNGAFYMQCRAARGPQGRFAVTVHTSDTAFPYPSRSALGSFWADGASTCSNVFHAIFPPNHPTCTGQSQGGAPGDGNSACRAVVSASSAHPGGVQVALVDASVRFVSDSVDYNSGHPMFSSEAGLSHNFNQPAPGGAFTEIQSPFGVWGAMGSVNGGESVSL
jgi:hypothetical protein